MQIRSVFWTLIYVIGVLPHSAYAATPVNNSNTTNVRSNARNPQPINNQNLNNGIYQQFDNDRTVPQNWNNNQQHNMQMNNQLQQPYNPNNQYSNQQQSQKMSGDNIINLNPDALVFYSQYGRYYLPTNQNIIPLESILSDPPNDKANRSFEMFNNASNTGIWLYVTRCKDLPQEAINELIQSNQRTINTYPGQQQNIQPNNNIPYSNNTNTYDNNSIIYNPSNNINNDNNNGPHGSWNDVNNSMNNWNNNNGMNSYNNGTNNINNGNNSINNQHNSWNNSNNNLPVNNDMNSVYNPNNNQRNVMPYDNSNNSYQPISYNNRNTSCPTDLTIDGNIIHRSNNSVIINGRDNTPIMLESVRDNNTGLCTIRLQQLTTQNNNSNRNTIPIQQQNYQNNYPTLDDTRRQMANTKTPIVQNGGQVQTLPRYSL